MSTSYSFGKLFRDIESGFQSDRLQTPRLPRVMNDEEWRYYDGQWRREDRPKPQGKKTLKDFLQERQSRLPATAVPGKVNKSSDRQSSQVNAKALKVLPIAGKALVGWGQISISNFSADHVWQATLAPKTAISIDPSGQWLSLESPAFEDSFFTHSGCGICSGENYMIGTGLQTQSRTPFVWEIVIEAPVYPISEMQDSMDEQAVQGIRWNRKSVESFQFECDVAIRIGSSTGTQTSLMQQRLLEAYSELPALDPMAILTKPLKALECDSGIIEFESPKSSIPIHSLPAVTPIDARWRMAAA